MHRAVKSGRHDTAPTSPEPVVRKVSVTSLTELGPGSAMVTGVCVERPISVVVCEIFVR